MDLILLKKLIFLILIGLVFSVAWGRDGDVYLAVTEGKIVLFPLPGCVVVGKEDDFLYGLFEKSDGNYETVCWEYKKMIYVHMRDNTVKSFRPSDIKTENGEPGEYTPPLRS